MTALWEVALAEAVSDIPVPGLVGTGVALPVGLYHLYRTDVESLLWIGRIFAVEFLYIERSSFTPEIDSRETE